MSKWLRNFRLPGWRPVGFRLSFSDLVVLIASIVAAVLFWPFSVDISVVILTVVGHFFLFCNVFRVRRRPELIWAGLFLVNSLAWYSADGFTGIRVLLTQLPATLVLIGRELFHDSYHGVGYGWFMRSRH